MAILKGRWLFQPPTTPEIDWSHPSSNGLIVVTSPVGDGLTHKVILATSTITTTGTSTTSLTVKGQARRGGTGKYIKGTLGQNYTAPFSLLMIVIPRTVAAAKGLFQIENANQVASSSPQLFVQADSANLKFYLNNNFQITATGVLVANRPIIIGFTTDGTSHKAFVNGNLVGTYTSAGGFAINAGGYWWLGTGYNGQSDSDYLEHFQWKRCLSTTEMRELGANPYPLFRSSSLVIAPSTGGISGTVNYTDANDTCTASGTTTVVGTLAKTNANDTSTASGTTTVVGTLAKTNANDTCAASGSVGSAISGTVNYTNANDTSVASGTTTVTGTLVKTNTNDNSTASGTTTVTGTFAKTNADDTCVASGSVGNAITGTVAYTNLNDTSTISGTTTVTGILARTNADDTSVASGTTTVIGVISRTNNNDTCVASGTAGSTATIARPVSDTVSGAWLPSTGVDLYAMIDETIADDADYIYATTATTCKMALNPVLDPLTSSGQIVSYRAWSTTGNGVIVRLKQGAAIIATWTHGTLPTSATTFQQTLSAAECDAITDYSALSIELTST